jgi:hypothetical protein
VSALSMGPSVEATGAAARRHAGAEVSAARASSAWGRAHAAALGRFIEGVM